MSYKIEQPIGNNIYVYEVQSYWDKSKQQARQKRKYIGKKDPKTGNIITPRKSNLPRLSKDFGNVYLLKHIAQSIGLTDILKKIFPDDYKEILAFAYYDISESKALYLFKSWIEMTYLPETKALTPKQITSFTKQMSSMEEERERFFNKWLDKRKPVNAVVFDITSLSGYSELIKLLEWGYNRDLEKLPQINIGVVFDQEGNIPLFYRIYPGSITDVKTLKNILKHLVANKLKQIIFILDRGFYSASNIREMEEESIDFLIPFPFKVKQAITLISKHKSILQSPLSAFKFKKEVIYYIKDNIVLDDINLTAHIYFSKTREYYEQNHFMNRLLDIEDKIKKRTFYYLGNVHEYLSQNFRGSDKLFDITLKEGKAYLTRKVKAISRKINKMGYMILLSNNHTITKDDALLYYRRRDHLEKLFDSLKNELDGKRLRGHSKETIEGRLYLKFISLILYSAISNKMKEQELFKKYSVKELLNEMKKIRVVEMTNGK
ncbi:MAG: IS1634 family transposase, partial [Anaerolineae bacterium]